MVEKARRQGIAAMVAAPSDGAAEPVARVAG
jgi:hypothetical protein